jgi:hypothetical protein
MSTEPLPALRIDGVETSVQRKGTAAKIGWASLVALLLPIAILGALKTVLPVPLRVALAIVSTVAPAMALLALAIRLFRWKRPGSIAVAGDRLVLERTGRSLRFPLADLVAGHVSPLKRLVTLGLSGGDIVHVHVPTVEDGQRLLVATGLDASRRTLQMKLGETFFLDFLTLLLGPGLFASVTARAGVFAIIPTMALTFGLFRAVRALLGPAEVVVGADGIIVRQSFSSRFIPFGRIASVDRGEPRRRYATPSSPVVFHLTDGTAVEARTRHLSAEQRAELTTRIDDAHRAWEAGGAGEAALARLDRNGRSPAAWREAMRELLEAPEGYREQAVTRDALVEVLESPAAPVERRVAAALALSGLGDADLRSRIRVAAGACADEPVRVALTLAADGALDDEAVEEALATASEVREVAERSRDFRR